MSDKAGPELDAKLAEALGWVFHRPHPESMRPEIWDMWHMPSGALQSCMEFRPSRDVATAIGVAEDLLRAGTITDWTAGTGMARRGDPPTDVAVSSAEVFGGGPEPVDIEGETVAHALTLALLAALQAEGSK